MRQCPHCHHDVIIATYGSQTVVLDPFATTYVAVAAHRIVPKEGDTVFLSTALVEHAAVCPVERTTLAASPRHTREGSHHD